MTPTLFLFLFNRAMCEKIPRAIQQESRGAATRVNARAGIALAGVLR
jgi:hypothetical protein